jgi:hypothetical protein
MYDVDLLVRKAQLRAVEARLEGLGYRPWDHPKTAEMNYATHHHSHPLVLPGGPPVELHTMISRPTDRFRIDVDGLWSRAQPCHIAGIETLALSPEDLLLHLCIHAAFDHRLLLGLRCFLDMRETIRHYDGRLDWETVRDRARQWGVDKYVYVALRLARELLEARVPDDVLASLVPRQFEPRLMALARAEVLSEESVVPSVSPRIAQLWASPALREKAVILLRSMFPPVRALARMYPAPNRAWPVCFYYPVRWKQLLHLYGRSLVELMSGRDQTVSEAERQNERAALRSWLRS